MSDRTSSPSALLYPYISNGAGTEEEEEQVDEEEEDIIFCSEDNVEEAAIYVNQELEVLGFTSILNEDNRRPSTVRLLNTAYDLLQRYHSTLKHTDSISMSLQRTRSDLKLQFETVARLKNELEETERRLTQYKEKERQVIVRNKSLSVQLKTEEEECRKLRHRMAHKEQQYEHELRKKEREYQRLNERLGQLVLDKSQERKLGIKMLNTLQRQRSNRKDIATDKEEKMYKLVFGHYEERQKELMLENSSLRDSLCNMEKELVLLLNQHYHGTAIMSPPTNGVEDSSMADEGIAAAAGEEGNEREQLLDSGHYQMPFDLVRQGIEDNLRDKCRRLRQYIASLQEDHASSGDNESDREVYDQQIEELERKLSDYRDIISQQEQLLKEQLEQSRSEQQPGLGFLNESHYLKRTELLDMREEKTRHREDHLKREEQRLNLLAGQLDRERRDFEDKKSQFFTQQLESSVFATPNKTTSTDLESFFLGLNSTPFGLSSRKNYPSSLFRTSKPFTPAPPTFKTPFKSKEQVPLLSSSSSPPPAAPDINLRQDISLTSDDGLEVLNEKTTDSN